MTNNIKVVLYILTFSILTSVLTGCITQNLNVAAGDGMHNLGPDKETKWDSSEESQNSSDSISELSSKISGIDKSQNEIKRSINKTSEVQQNMEKRNEVIDRRNPNLSKERRRSIYDGVK